VPDKYRHTLEEKRAMRRDLKQIIRTKDERGLMAFLRKHGIKDEHPRFSQIVKAFREGKIDDLI
jgi:hypothetical protein